MLFHKTTTKTKKGNKYYALRDAAARRSRQAALSGRDIAPLPEVVNPGRRKRAEKSLEYFCKTYFKDKFSLTLGPVHKKALKLIEKVVLFGGLFALAMPRGSGKTTNCEVGALWAAICGHRDYIFFVGAAENSALSSLETIKTELESNDLLLEDFPEICYPIRCLEGISHRCRGQLLNNKRTHISWTKKYVVFPDTPGAAGAQARIECRGITGRIRGAKFDRPNGVSVRPDLVVIDDPQTDESAKSPAQNAKREAVLSGAILELAGPTETIAGLMPCTVIERDDLADRILNSELHPEWTGIRTSAIINWPTDKDLWKEYAKLYKTEPGEAAAFYRKNRRAMDKGAKVYWPARKKDGDVSALQSLMNVWITKPEIFLAEYQNQPKDAAEDLPERITAADVVAKVGACKRNEIPPETTALTVFVDIGWDRLHYVTLAAWAGFNSAVVSYGIYPERGSLRDVAGSPEAAVTVGLTALDQLLFGATFRGPGGDYQVDRVMIDAGNLASTVYSFIPKSPNRNKIIASHGEYIGPNSAPISKFKRKPGETIGDEWISYIHRQYKNFRFLRYDTNYWKLFTHRRILTPSGDPGEMVLFTGADHWEFARQVAESETKQPLKGKTGRVVWEFKQRPGRENHFLDCIVGAAVAASTCGITLEKENAKRAARKKRRGPKKAKSLI